MKKRVGSIPITPPRIDTNMFSHIEHASTMLNSLIYRLNPEMKDLVQRWNNMFSHIEHASATLNSLIYRLNPEMRDFVQRWNVMVTHIFAPMYFPSHFTYRLRKTQCRIPRNRFCILTPRSQAIAVELNPSRINCLNVRITKLSINAPFIRCVFLLH